jgi:hypothetical protein
MRSTASWHVLTPANSSGAEGSTKVLPLPSRRVRSIGSALNAAKFVVFALAALLASASAPAALLVSGVGAGVGSAALERRRDRRAVAAAAGIRESDGRYFVVDAVDVRGGGGITAGLFVLGEATVAELVAVGCL